MSAQAAGAASNDNVLLDVRGLRTHFFTEDGTAPAVDGVDFQIFKEEVVGLVGESGSGKSVASLSIMKLIPDPPGRIVGGSILFKGQDLVALPYPELRKIRGNEISMVFQEPMTSLNPVFTVGEQIAEPIMLHQGKTRADAYAGAVEMLSLVGIPSPAARVHDYPHQFSGGMRQRVMIAIALACRPSLLIADEPTTALDVTVQAQILDLMLHVKEHRKEAAILLITHDLAVVAELCQRVIVMYGGKIQEIAPSAKIFTDPKHPYTRGLLRSLPGTAKKVRRLETIPGMVPSIFNLPKGCKFCTRCPDVMQLCETDEPPILEVAPGQSVRCHLYSSATPGAGASGATKASRKNGGAA